MNFTINVQISTISTLSWLEFSKIQKVVYKLFREVLVASYEQSRFSVKFRLKTVYTAVLIVIYTLPTKFLVISISGKFSG